MLTARINLYISHPSLFLKLFSQLGGEISGSVALVRLDDLPARELLVGVGGPDNPTGLVVDNGQGGEAVARTELAAPARSDGEDAAVRRTSVRARGVRGLHNIGTMGRSVRTDLDAEGPGAFGLGVVADALHVPHSPIRSGSHHGHAVVSGGGGGKDRRGSEERGQKKLSDLHACGSVDYRGGSRDTWNRDV